MSAGYVAVASGESLTPGTQYRATLHLRAPYTSENIAKLESRWRQLTGAGSHFELDKVRATYPDRKTGRWTFVIEYHVRAGSGVVLFDNLANLARNVVSFVIDSAALVLTVVEKFVVDTATGLVNAAMAPVHEVLNPGVLILAVVGIFLITRRG